MHGTSLSYKAGAASCALVDPVAHADRHGALADRADAQREASKRMYEAEITQIFTVGIRMFPAKWLKVSGIAANKSGIEQVPLQDAVADLLSFGKPLEVLMQVLQRSDCDMVQELREALAADYAERNADLLAELGE